MKKISIILSLIAFLACAEAAMGQSSDYGTHCQFFNINKTVKAKIGVGDDASYQRKTVKALWPVMLNGKECPKLQEAICHWLTGKDGIANMDRAIESALYTDCEDRPFGESGPYIILDNFDEDEVSSSISVSTIELQSLGNRFALFHLLYNKYFAGAAHGMYGHKPQP